MSVSGVTTTGLSSQVYQQTPATSKANSASASVTGASATSDSDAAAQAAQEANQVATEQQANLRGASQGIDKLV
jgi:hypothetical protein